MITNEMQKIIQMNAFYKSISVYEQRISSRGQSTQSGMESFELENVSQFFRTEQTPDGRTVHTRDELAIKELGRSLGKKIIITNNDEPWDIPLSKMYRQDRFKSKVDCFKNKLQDGFMNTSSLEKRSLPSSTSSSPFRPVPISWTFWA